MDNMDTIAHGRSHQPGPVPHHIGPVPKYTIIWDRSHIIHKAQFEVVQAWLNFKNIGYSFSENVTPFWL